MRTYGIVSSVAIAWMLVLALMCVDGHAQQKNSGSAELSGRVNGANGTAIVVHLRLPDDNPVRYYDGYEETTAEDGSFHFADIAPGTYQVETATSGFRLAAPMAITLRPDEKRRGVAITVTPSYSLCGRLTEQGAAARYTWGMSIAIIRSLARSPGNSSPPRDRIGASKSQM